MTRRFWIVVALACVARREPAVVGGGASSIKDSRSDTVAEFNEFFRKSGKSLENVGKGVRDCLKGIVDSMGGGKQSAEARTLEGMKEAPKKAYDKLVEMGNASQKVMEAVAKCREQVKSGKSLLRSSGGAASYSPSRDVIREADLLYDAFLQNTSAAETSVKLFPT